MFYIETILRKTFRLTLDLGNQLSPSLPEMHYCPLPEEHILKNQSLQPLHTCYDPKVYCLISHPYVLSCIQEMCEDRSNPNNENTHSNMLHASREGGGVWGRKEIKTVKSTKTTKGKPIK